ncbi:MAG: cyclic nucleotide-binding/CBS domain-containing protein [Rhodothermaceae bacterium]
MNFKQGERMYTAEQIISEKKSSLICVDSESTIAEAIKMMNNNKIGAIVVKTSGKIAGIWTERDLIKNLAENSFDVNTAQIGDYMTKELIIASHDFSVYKLLDIFLGKRLRHLFIEKNGEIIGLLSQGDVTKASLNEKTKELNELNKAYKWDYYETWKFNRNQ